MKGNFMHKAIFFLLLTLTSAQAGLSRLDALAMLESGNNDWAVGGAGEVSRYQIRPNVWRIYTPLSSYQYQRLAGWVADQYLAFLERNFQKQAGRPPTDFDLYVVWNAGLSYYSRAGFSPRRVRPEIRNRAQRFVNLRQMAAATGSNTPTPVLYGKATTR